MRYSVVSDSTVTSRRYIGRCSQKGFSLIEILIATMLGIFITYGALTIYISNKDAFRVQQAVSFTQKNARFIINQFNFKISSAGYSGLYSSFVNSADLENTLTGPTDIRWDLSRPVYGYNNVSASDTIASVTGFVAGSDVLILKSMIGDTNVVSNSTSDTISLNATSGYEDGDILIITDADKASIFQIDDKSDLGSGVTEVELSVGSSPQPGNLSELTNLYDTSARIGHLETLIYFIKPKANGRSALYEGHLETSDNNSPVTVVTELISNVENIQFVYGVDADDNGSVEKYVDAANVSATEWKQVKSIGISLLLTSESNGITIDDNSYSFDSTDFTYKKDTTLSASADKRMRKSYSTHVKLKNI